MDRPIIAKALAEADAYQIFSEIFGAIAPRCFYPIKVTYEIPTWRNPMDRYDEAELAIRRANFRGRFSEENLQAVMTWLRDNEVADDEVARLRAARRRPTSQFAAELQRISTEAAEKAGGSAGKMFASGFAEGIRQSLPTRDSQVLRTTIMLRKLLMGLPMGEREPLLQTVRDMLAAVEPNPNIAENILRIAKEHRDADKPDDDDEGTASVPVA